MTLGCDLFFDEHAGKLCADPGHAAALTRRADTAAAWSAIERSDDDGGQRDFLDGRPINCGAGFELQAVEERSDDYGEYLVSLPHGPRVRYELDVPRPGEAGRRIVLYTRVAGHEFRTPHRQWMRFRWPAPTT